MNRKYLKYIVFSIIITLIYSCDKNKVYDNTISIPEGIWDKKEKASIEFNASDTTSLNNVYVNIRNKGSYAYRNIYIFLTTIYPDGKKSIDTIDCILSNEKGKWLGSGVGDLWFNRLLFKKKVAFIKKGKYTFQFEQAMRNEKLDGISDIGIRIEKAEK